LLFLIFTVIILPFSVVCQALYKTYLTGVPLTKRAKITGTICSILITAYTAALIIGSVDLIIQYSAPRFFNNFKNLIFHAIFWGMTVNAVYLCFAYWIIRKNTGTRVTEILSGIGRESER